MISALQAKAAAMTVAIANERDLLVTWCTIIDELMLSNISGRQPLTACAQLEQNHGNWASTTFKPILAG
jgi:hypothetical protein